MADDPKSPKDPSVKSAYTVDDFMKKGFPAWKESDLPLVACKDNELCFERLLKYGSLGALGGTFVGVTDVMIYTIPTSVLVAFGTLSSHTAVGGLVGASYIAATCASSKMRGGKTDAYNHFIGGLASGFVLGMRTRSQKVGIWAGLGLGTLAFTLKSVAMEGWKFTPQKQYHRTVGLGWHRTTDFGTRRPEA